MYSVTFVWFEVLRSGHAGENQLEFWRFSWGASREMPIFFAHAFGSHVAFTYRWAGRALETAFVGRLILMKFYLRVRTYGLTFIRPQLFDLVEKMENGRDFLVSFLEYKSQKTRPFSRSCHRRSRAFCVLFRAQKKYPVRARRFHVRTSSVTLSHETPGCST